YSLSMPFRQNRLETPFLKAYLEKAPANPPYVPGWITPAAFLVFALLLGLLWIAPIDGCLSLIVASVVAWAVVWFLRSRYPPVTEQDVATEKAFAVIRNLAAHKTGSGLTRRLPSDVLLALEEAVSAHALATARWTTEDALAYPGGLQLIDSTLYNCFRAATPVTRSDAQPLREWRAICTNQMVVGGIVDAIRVNTDKLTVLGGGAERLQALEELRQPSPDQTLRIELGGQKDE
ncbi:MAG TPA: hypothetical protein VG944_13000, partial [Fimbriimonas sp.]|nr:hypothetical protein [Fimbriimonas sp.]